MKKLLSADLVRYNANNRGTRTGDCTARAISLAFNMDYSKARKALNDSAKENWRLNWDYNSTSNVRRVIELLGGGKDTKEPDKITLNAWADEHPSGTYILHCNKNGIERGPGGHLVCIIDGKIYDSWDSRDCYVLSYHVISNGIKGTDVTDIRGALNDYFDPKMTKEYWQIYTVDVFNTIINKTSKLKKLVDKYDVNVSLSIDFTKVTIAGYTFTYKYEIDLEIPEYKVAESYPSKFSVVFKPTMQASDIPDYFENTFFGKMYSFVLNVIRKAEDICKGSSLYEGYDIPQNGLYFSSTYEHKVFSALPYWVRRITKNFSAESPLHNDYSDRVILEIYVPPFDTEYNNPNRRSNTRYFHAYRISDLKDALEYYKETGDYEKAYEIAADY